MSKKQNPKLKEGDRIVLIYMPGEDIDTGTKGKVKKITPQPSFGSEFDYMYDVEWYDEDDKVISTLSLIPQSDTWMLDPEFNQNKSHEKNSLILVIHDACFCWIWSNYHFINFRCCN